MSAASSRRRRLHGTLPAWIVPMALALVGPSMAAETPLAHDGDLLFQTPRSAQSLAIQQATGSRWSHAGIVVYRHGHPFVLEAEASVRYTPLAQWLARGPDEDGRCAVRRLRDATAIDAPAAHEALRASAASMLGRSYDSQFGCSDQRLYCSEWVWKLCRDAFGITLAPLSRWRDFRLDGAETLARLQQRFGARLPSPDGLLIAPDGLYRSTLLVTVAEG